MKLWLADSSVDSVADALVESIVEDPLGADDAEGGLGVVVVDVVVGGGVVGPGLEVDDPVLAPLVLLHGLLSVEFLVAYVALEGSVIPMGSLVNLKQTKQYIIQYIENLNLRNYEY